MRLTVLLENIRSKFNVGSIFRSAEAFQFDQIILTGFTPKLPDKEIEKTAIGAEKVVPWQYWQNAKDAVGDLKNRGVKIIVAEVHPNAIKLPDFSFAPEGEYCLVMGNEITGVSEEILALADVIVEIPMLGKVKESLNVEVSFGILAAWLRFHK